MDIFAPTEEPSDWNAGGLCPVVEEDEVALWVVVAVALVPELVPTPEEVDVGDEEEELEVEVAEEEAAVAEVEVLVTTVACEEEEEEGEEAEEEGEEEEEEEEETGAAVVPTGPVVATKNGQDPLLQFPWIKAQAVPAKPCSSPNAL